MGKFDKYKRKNFHSKGVISLVKRFIKLGYNCLDNFALDI